MPGGIADQHRPVDVRLGRPGVVAADSWRTVLPASPPRPAPAHGKHDAALGGEELLGATRPGEAVPTGQPGAHVGPRPSTPLVEQQEPVLAGIGEGVELGWHPVEAVEEEPRDEGRRLLALELDPHLTADRRVAAVGTDDQSGGEVLASAVDLVAEPRTSHRRRAPRTTRPSPR